MSVRRGWRFPLVSLRDRGLGFAQRPGDPVALIWWRRWQAGPEQAAGRAGCPFPTTSFPPPAALQVRRRGWSVRRGALIGMQGRKAVPHIQY